MRVVAISAWKGSGKDDAAKRLIESYGFRRFSFADALKEMVAEQYDIPLRYCHDNSYKEMALGAYPVKTSDKWGEIVHSLLSAEMKNHPVTGELCWTPRALCILEGSIKRSVNSKYWVQRVFKQIKAHGGNAVITDMRYKSEANDIIAEFGSKAELVRVNRFDDIDTQDPSERDLDDYDRFSKIIENRSTLEDYMKKINLLGRGEL